MISIEPPSSSFDLSTVSKTGLARFVKRASKAVGLQGSVDVLLTSDAEIKRLNKLFRGKNKATDVLSFPAAAESAGVAGDVAVSLETAARHASEHGHTLGDEIRVLLLHALLHLHGEDHETDTGEMERREAGLRASLGLKTSLIARAAAVRAGRPRAGRPAGSSR